MRPNGCRGSSWALAFGGGLPAKVDSEGCYAKSVSTDGTTFEHDLATGENYYQFSEPFEKVYRSGCRLAACRSTVTLKLK